MTGQQTPLAPGIYDLKAEVYHRDDLTEQPSLSSSIARLLCTSSPKHAWTAHPRLNPDHVREEKEQFDIGTAAHALLLESSGGAGVAICDFENWRTAAAQGARDEARAAGKLPLLAKHWDAVQAMVRATLDQLAAHEADPPLFTAGEPEQTIIWDEDGVACRARLDWLHDDYRNVDDLKTVGRSARREDVERHIVSMGYDVQAALYVRGVRAVTGVTPNFRWAFVETSPPFALSVIAPDAELLELADEKVDHAVATWKECLASGEWPGYSTKVETVSAPPWAVTQWLERTAA